MAGRDAYIDEWSVFMLHQLSFRSSTSSFGEKLREREESIAKKVIGKSDSFYSIQHFYYCRLLTLDIILCNGSPRGATYEKNLKLKKPVL
jgi:hypothetical protein